MIHASILPTYLTLTPLTPARVCAPALLISETNARRMRGGSEGGGGPLEPHVHGTPTPPEATMTTTRGEARLQVMREARGGLRTAGHG